MALEEAFQTTLDESMLAGSRTMRRDRGAVCETQLRVLRQRAQQTPRARDDVAVCTERATPSSDRPIDFPSWNRSTPVVDRPPDQPADVDPAARAHLHGSEGRGTEPSGRDRRGRSSSPPITRATWTRQPFCWRFHPRWRYRVAPGDGEGVLYGALQPAAVPASAWFTNSLELLPGLPVLQRVPAAAARSAARARRCVTSARSSRTATRSSSFPRGGAATTEHIDRFMPGVGMIGAKLDVPVIPVRIEGLDKVLNRTMTLAEAGTGQSSVRRAPAAPGGRLSGPGRAGRGGRPDAVALQRRPVPGVARFPPRALSLPICHLLAARPRRLPASDGLPACL